MAWAYFQNQTAFDGYSNAVCADQQIPRAGYNQATQAPMILDCWTDGWVEPIQLRGQGNVRTWAAHIPDAHLTQYAAVLGLTTTDDQIVIGTGPPPTGNGTPVGTVIVQGTSYTQQPNTLTYKKTKPATWTDPKTGITFDTTTGLPV